MTAIQDSLDAFLEAEAETPARILVVDDEKSNVMLLSGILKGLGQIAFALSGEDALKKAIDTPPDLILLDIELPNMDGKAVLKEMQQEQTLAGVPVIFVTARDDEQDEEEGLNLGAIDYITKPFRPAIVQARVRNQLLLRRYAKGLEMANIRLERLANTDPLTGAYNRRYFMEALKAEYNRSERYKNPCSVIMADIDYFKKINDTYGHDVGDIALCEFSRTLENVLRKQDTLARIGGEEFAILMPETPVDRIEPAADKLMEAIRGIRVDVPEGGLKMTASLGVAALDTSAEGFSSILSRADQALYRAKEGGRDRVEYYA